ncbi:MAG: hypothetical protein BRC30_01985 [Nanohaloarchaea archaeon SW_7_46_7]|nr:MAG: hypothetical protein BRC30_01985 [Nanohaloarchaea archaeon SW_7_46_7]
MPNHEFAGNIPSTTSKAYDEEKKAEKAFQELYKGLDGIYDLREIGGMSAIYEDGKNSPVATREGDTLTLLGEDVEETFRDLGYELEVKE